MIVGPGRWLSRWKALAAKLKDLNGIPETLWYKERINLASASLT